MDVRSLLQFLQIAKDGSYTKAAANLYLAQPTLSKTIHNLEDELGVPLFQKDKQRIELTEHGRRLVEIATPIVNDFQQIPQWLHDRDGMCIGSASIGVTPMLASLYLISSIAQFCKQYPQMELNLYERSTLDVQQMVEDGLCDIGMCMRHPALLKAPLDIYPLFTKEIVALIPRDNPLSRNEAIHMSALRDEKFNIYTSGHAIKDAIYSRCREAGFTPQVNFTSNTTQLLIRLSETGNGITILPKPFLSQAEYPNLIPVPFDPVFPWQCCLIAKKGRYQTYAIRTLIDFILASFKEV